MVSRVWVTPWSLDCGISWPRCGRFMAWLGKVQPKMIGMKRSDDCCLVWQRVMTFSNWRRR